MIKDFFSLLSINEGIALIALLVSITSVILSVISIKLTQRPIEESNRPYIVATIVGNVSYRAEKIFMIKNYGNTGADIEQITFSESITNPLLNQNLEALSNTFFAPGQSFFPTLEMPNGTTELVGTLTISYRDYKKKYTERCLLNSKIINTHIQTDSSKLEEFESKLLNAIHNQGRNSL